MRTNTYQVEIEERIKGDRKVVRVEAEHTLQAKLRAETLNPGYRALSVVA